MTNPIINIDITDLVKAKQLINVSKSTIAMKNKPMAAQHDAIEWGKRGLVKRRSFGLFCAPSTGKTFMTLSLVVWLIQETPINKIIIVSPSPAINKNWISEIAKHVNKPFLLPKIEFVTYGQLQAGTPSALEILSSSDDKSIVIFDESHRLKNFTGAAGGLIIRWLHKLRTIENALVPLIFSLTGTPYSYSLRDMIIQLYLTNALKSKHFGFDWYMDEDVIYGRTKLKDSKIMYDILEPNRVKTWLSMFENSCYILEKTDVYTPQDSIYNVVEYKGGLPTKGGNLAKQMHFTDYDLHDSYPSGNLHDSYFSKLRQANGYTKVNDRVDHNYQSLLSNPKLNALSQLMTIFNGSQAIIYCQMVKDIQLITLLCTELGYSCIEHVGKTEDKIKNIEIFKSGSVQFLIATLPSLNEGIELTQCLNMVYYNTTTRLVHYLQSKDRINRPSTQGTTNYYFMVGNNFEKRAMEIMKEKENTHKTILTDLKEYVGYRQKYPNYEEIKQFFGIE